MEFSWMQFAIFLWYFMQLACIGSAPTPSPLNNFACAAIVLAACFSGHFLAHAMVVTSGYFLYDAWKKAHRPDSPVMSLSFYPNSCFVQLRLLLGEILAALLHCTCPTEGSLSCVSVPEINWNEEDEPKDAGFPNGFSPPETHWDDEDDVPESSLVVFNAQGHSANSGDLLKKVQELSKSNKVMLAGNTRMTEERDQLKADNKHLFRQNFDLNSRLKMYQSGRSLDNTTKRAEEAEQRLADVNAEKRNLQGEIDHLNTVIEEYLKLQSEAKEREKEHEEQINSFRRADQCSEAKLNSLDIIINTLHELAGRGGHITEATVFVLNELIRANIPATHLQIDLGKFAYYVKYVGLQWSKVGSMAGGYRASMSTYLGGDSRTNLVFIHNGGHQEAMPTRPVSNRQDFEQVCKDIEARFLSSNNIVFSSSPACTGFSRLTVDTGHSCPVASSWINRPPIVGSGSLLPLAGSNSAALAIQGPKATTQLQERTNNFFGSRKGNQGGDSGTVSGDSGALKRMAVEMKTDAEAKQAAEAAKKAASSSGGIVKKSASSNQGISIKGASDAAKLNALEQAMAELVKERAQAAAATPASNPLANPFVKNMSNANALPQNRGAGMSFSIPIAPPSGGSRSLARDSANTPPQNRGAGSSFSIPNAPPSGGSRGLARGSARDADSVERL
ncbi:hypothetical protein PMIN04_009676 [Paraphaeosphaeria minitans]